MIHGACNHQHHHRHQHHYPQHHHRHSRQYGCRHSPSPSTPSSSCWSSSSVSRCKNEEWMTREALLVPTEFVEGHFALLVFWRKNTRIQKHGKYIFVCICMYSMYIWVLLVPTEFVEGRFALPMLFCIVCYEGRIQRSKVSICIIYALLVPSAFVERHFALVRILLHCDILWSIANIETHIAARVAMFLSVEPSVLHTLFVHRERIT